MMGRRDNHGLLIIVSIFTFIVVIIGASFAYFTAKSRSDDKALDMASHFVQIAYNDGNELQADDLIPTSDSIAIRSYNGKSVNGQCKDDNERTVCSIYKFEVTNLGSIAQHLGARINIGENNLLSLRYSLFNVTNMQDFTDVINKIKVSEGDLPNTVSNDDLISSERVEPFYIIGKSGQLEQIVNPNSTEKYELVLWLHDTGENQDNEQGKSFSASVTVSLTDQNHVYGYIEDVNGD